MSDFEMLSIVLTMISIVTSVLIALNKRQK